MNCSCHAHRFEEMRNNLISVWNRIADAFSDIEELIFERKEPVEHHYNWHVPQSIVKNDQVVDRKPTFTRIRNCI